MMNIKTITTIVFCLILGFPSLLVAEPLVAEEKTKSAAALLIEDSSFSCIRDMTKVRALYVDNLLGDIEATLAVANSEDGGTYPVGSVVQLVPTEVMVKRKKNFSPATNDWEFFELKVSKTASIIDKRGTTDVINRFGGNCLDCHIKAEPKWDLICETEHGCDPLPLTPAMITVIQKTDPRCETNVPLNAEEQKAAVILQKMFAR